MAELVLWDIDNTLIENAGVSKEIYATTFEILTGQRPTHPARTEGRTDPEIISNLFEAHGAPGFAWKVVETALVDAGLGHRDSLAKRGRVMPGALDLIGALAAVPTVVQTVVTGNIRANATVKLSAFGLLDWLDVEVGAYGSDDSDRSQLVAISRDRACLKYGGSFARRLSTIVIGDTPRDVQAAHAGSARVLAVASGVHSEAELRAAGADDVLPNLLDTATAIRIVLALTLD